MADKGISIRFVRDWDLASEEPSFDYIPTEAGREAARKLYVAALGEPRQRYVTRFDVLYGVGCIAPNSAVVVKGVS